jgi:hypothetical protein
VSAAAGASDSASMPYRATAALTWDSADRRRGRRTGRAFSLPLSAGMLDRSFTAPESRAGCGMARGGGISTGNGDGNISTEGQHGGLYGRYGAHLGFEKLGPAAGRLSSHSLARAGSGARPVAAGRGAFRRGCPGARCPKPSVVRQPIRQALACRPAHDRTATRRPPGVAHQPHIPHPTFHPRRYPRRPPRHSLPLDSLSSAGLLTGSCRTRRRGRGLGPPEWHHAARPLRLPPAACGWARRGGRECAHARLQSRQKSIRTAIATRGRVFPPTTARHADPFHAAFSPRCHQAGPTRPACAPRAGHVLRRLARRPSAPRPASRPASRCCDRRRVSGKHPPPPRRC